MSGASMRMRLRDWRWGVWLCVMEDTTPSFAPDEDKARRYHGNMTTAASTAGGACSTRVAPTLTRGERRNPPKRRPSPVPRACRAFRRRPSHATYLRAAESRNQGNLVSTDSVDSAVRPGGRATVWRRGRTSLRAFRVSTGAFRVSWVRSRERARQTWPRYFPRTMSLGRMPTCHGPVPCRLYRRRCDESRCMTERFC